MDQPTVPAAAPEAAAAPAPAAAPDAAPADGGAAAAAAPPPLPSGGDTDMTPEGRTATSLDPAMELRCVTPPSRASSLVALTPHEPPPPRSLHHAMKLSIDEELGKCTGGHVEAADILGELLKAA